MLACVEINSILVVEPAQHDGDVVEEDGGVVSSTTKQVSRTRPRVCCDVEFLTGRKVTSVVATSDEESFVVVREENSSCEITTSAHACNQLPSCKQALAGQIEHLT